MSAENQVVIEEPIVTGGSNTAEEKPSTEESLKESGLSTAEVEMAKRQGIIPRDASNEEKKVVPAEDKKKIETPPAVLPPAINPDELDTFEKIHDLYQAKPEEFYKLPKSMRNMYHNSKGIYKRLKEEEERRKDIEGKSEFSKVHESVARVKLDKLKARLSSPEGLTIEELNEIIGKEEARITDENKPLARKDLEDIDRAKEVKASEESAAQKEQAGKGQRRIIEAEEYAKENISDVTGGKYSSLNEVVSLAEEVAKKKPRYFNAISDAILDDKMTPADVIDVIVDIARLNEKWGASATTEKKDGNATVDKMVKNAGKQQTSAALSGGKGSRVVTLDELTPEDAVKLTEQQWNNLPRHVRDRILKQA